MESDGSLPCSGQPATGTYSEPDECNVYLPNVLHRHAFQYYPICAYVF